MHSIRQIDSHNVKILKTNSQTNKYIMMLSTALPRWWSGRKCHGMQLWLTDVVWGLWEKAVSAVRAGGPPALAEREQV